MKLRKTLILIVYYNVALKKIMVGTLRIVYVNQITDKDIFIFREDLIWLFLQTREKIINNLPYNLETCHLLTLINHSIGNDANWCFIEIEYCDGRIYLSGIDASRMLISSWTLILTLTDYKNKMYDKNT